MTLGCFRGPLRHPKELLNYLGALDMLNYVGSAVEGLINFLRVYCMVDVTNIGTLKLCEIHTDLICPDKIQSTIILVIILKCYDQLSLSIAVESDFKHASYGFTLMPLEEYY